MYKKVQDLKLKNFSNMYKYRLVEQEEDKVKNSKMKESWHLIL